MSIDYQSAIRTARKYTAGSHTVSDAHIDGLCDVLKEVGAERDALAAHVERMRDVWQRLHLKSPAPVEVLQAYSYVMREAPTTSLARLNARWQAETLESLLAEAEGHVTISRGALIDRVRELHRQAEAQPHSEEDDA